MWLKCQEKKDWFCCDINQRKKIEKERKGLNSVYIAGGWGLNSPNVFSTP